MRCIGISATSSSCSRRSPGSASPRSTSLTRIARPSKRCSRGPRERAPSTPYLGALWSRESRYLPEDVQTELREVLRATIRQCAVLLRRERPDLSVRQADLLASGIQSVLASPSHARRASGGSDAGGDSPRRRSAPSPRRPWCPRGRRFPRRLAGRAPYSRRERLLIAAMELFATNGYQETSMDDIGAIASVTGPNLYGYFDSKAALLQAVIERGMHGLWIDLDRALAENGEPREALRAVIRGYVHVTAGWSIDSLSLSGEEEVERVARRHQREYVTEWVELVRASRARHRPAERERAGPHRVRPRRRAHTHTTPRRGCRIPDEPRGDDGGGAHGSAVRRHAPCERRHIVSISKS